MSEEPLKPRSHFWRYISDFLLCRSPGRLGSDIALTIEQPVGGPSSDLGTMNNISIVAEDIQDTMPSLDVRGSTGIAGSVQEGKMVDDKPKVDDHSNLDTRSLSGSRPLTNHPSKAAKSEAEAGSDALTYLNVNHSVVREEARMAEDQPLITDYQSSDPDNESPSSWPTELPADRLPKDAESKARVGWMAFRAILKIAKECADAFPPLKAAVGGLSAVLDRVDEVNDAATDFADVKSQIDAFAETLRDHQVRFSEPSLALRRRFDGLARALDLQKSSIEDKVDRGIIKRIIESSDDKAEIARHLRTLGHLVNQFTIATALNTDANVEEMRKDAKLEKLNHVAEAAFNGPHSSGKGCMPGTRISVLSELLSWALDPGAPKLYWLTGLAGTGKSAIAYSLCRLLDDAGLLGASFFCSRQALSEQKDIFRVLPTLARLLARTSSSFAVALLECLDKCPDAAKLSLVAQFGTLLMEPCDLLPCNESRVHVLVVDALDECDDPEEVGRFLQLVVDAGPALKLKIFMTSCPEHQIRQELSPLKSNQVLYLHKIEETLVQADIKLYINHHIFKIFEKYLSKTEISSRQVDNLVQQSGNLFIYAFTVLQYIGSKNADPQHRLNKLTNEGSAMARSLGNQLDSLYRFVFEEAFKDLDEDEITLMKHCFSCVLAGYKLMSVETMCKFMAKKHMQIRSAFSGFYSLLDIPDDDNKGLISAFHASFGDYVTNVKLYKHFAWYIDISEAHHYMTSQCMDIMKQKLKFNIFECKTSYLSNAHLEKPELP